MLLNDAIELVKSTSVAMDSICSQPVFDEFSIVQLKAEKLYLCWYHGQRRDEHIRMFKQDTALLKKESRSRYVNRYDVGDYEFVLDGSGTQSESFLVVGENLFLICSNTRKSMADISANPLWLKAQTAFIEMSEKFRFDPLVVAEANAMDEITS